MNPAINHEAVELAQTLAAGIAGRADRADREGRLPAEDVALLRESGYLGLAVPVEFGGAGESLLTCVAAQVELAKGSASTALVAAMQHQVIGHQRETMTWRPDACERIMREAAAGGLLNHLGSEPRLGSPSRGGLPETTATPAGDGAHWIVNGHKTWATGGLVRLVAQMLAQLPFQHLLQRRGKEPGKTLPCRRSRPSTAPWPVRPALPPLRT